MVYNLVFSLFNNLKLICSPLPWIHVNMFKFSIGSETCTFHSSLAATETLYKLEASVDKPPRKFTIEFCVEDMERLYKTHTGKELGSETSKKDKGRSRVEHALTILKQEGVLGKSRSTAEKVKLV